MALYWLLFDNQGKTEAYLQRATYLITARLQAQVSGQKGQFLNGVELPNKLAMKIPSTMEGKTLSAEEAEALMKKLGT